MIVEQLKVQIVWTLSLLSTYSSLSILLFLYLKHPTSMAVERSPARNIQVFNPTTNTLNVRWEAATGPVQQYRVVYAPLTGVRPTESVSFHHDRGKKQLLTTFDLCSLVSILSQWGSSAFELVCIYLILNSTLFSPLNNQIKTLNEKAALQWMPTSTRVTQHHQLPHLSERLKHYILLWSFKNIRVLSK